MPKKFDFISPGILLNEVDESILPQEVEDEGPLIIGRALKGPAMKPVRIRSNADLVTIFGKPIDGAGSSNVDVWRNGNLTGPTYAMYAAQAHLASNSTPVNFLRLVGEQAPDATDDAGYAGWSLSGKSESTVADQSTAYGLFIAPSGSTATDQPSGSLAAVFYCSASAVMLSGSTPLGEANVLAAGAMIKSSGAGRFTIRITSSVGESEPITFDFDPASEYFIRNQFNTNPQKLESSTNFGASDTSTAASNNYWLGETFELEILDNVITGSAAAGDHNAVLLPLQRSTTVASNWHYRRYSAQKAATGWFLNRTLNGVKERLFKLIAHSAGEWETKNLHVEIADLRMGNQINPNSSFTVIIMQGSNTLERYTRCTLSPTDENYIAKRIGDQYLEWDSVNKKYNVRGLYASRSDYVYVSVADAVKDQTISDQQAIPVGFEGPLRHAAWKYASGSTDALTATSAYDAQVALANSYVGQGSSSIAANNAPLHGSTGLITGLAANQSGSFYFPTVKLTTQGTKNGSDDYLATDIFGLRHIQGSRTNRDASYIDVLRPPPESAAGTGFSAAFTFTLEDIVKDGTTGLFYHNSGSAGYAGNISGILGEGVKRFAAPMPGGYDGVDIKKVEPFSDYLIGSSDTKQGNYIKNTLEKALDTIEDPEVVGFDLLSIPGLTNTNITNRVINICETRGDSLAIFDLDGIYRHKWDNGGTVKTGSAADVQNTAKTRLINSSYAATYYPSIQLVDSYTGNRLFAPPSVAAIGAIARSQGLSEPWFAPAGFNRGGIRELGGTQGPRVVGVTEQLKKSERDDLYQLNINPIARFPASGDIVIFGQKTMQQFASALDRINVRRLLLFLKRRIGKVAETILFDQNVNATWNRFKAQAEAILSDVQARLGITEYKLVLDETTTTADLVDRNILYAKILIKPARAIEFIVVDFVVTRSGIEL
jgi:hypothetical protein